MNEGKFVAIERMQIRIPQIRNSELRAESASLHKRPNAMGPNNKPHQPELAMASSSIEVVIAQ
jgi:hypothetical protein